MYGIFINKIYEKSKAKVVYMTNIMTGSYRYRKKDNVISLIVAVAFLFNSICLLANILIPSVANFGELFIAGILLLGFASSVISSMKINFKLLLINGTILLAIIASYLFYNLSSIVMHLMINYFAWGIGITVIMMQRYDIRKTLNASYWIAFITILLEILTNANRNYDSMVWTYAIFPCVAIVIVHFAYIRFSGLLLKMTYIPGFLMLVKFLLNANRGGIISILVLTFFILIKSVNGTRGRVRNRKAVGIVLLIFALIIGVFFEPIISFLYDFMLSINLEIDSLKKLYRLILEENIMNNRNELYAYAWKGFLSSPIWGNGIGGFSVNHGGWTHNFILQLLYEGGLLLSLLVLVPLTKNSLFILKQNCITRYEYSLFILLFSTSIPRLLFSTELWNTQAFWMLFAFCMLTKNKYYNYRGDIAE